MNTAVAVARTLFPRDARTPRRPARQRQGAMLPSIVPISCALAPLVIVCNAYIRLA